MGEAVGTAVWGEVIIVIIRIKKFTIMSERLKFAFLR
jgi:hypothetical protein